MCFGIIGKFATFESDNAVEAVVFDHVEGRGFLQVATFGCSPIPDYSKARTFSQAEYRMNHRLFTYAKSTIAVMGGIKMGGGFGIILPCRYRVATENTGFAMPEPGIGLFPDVGDGWYLLRLTGQVGKCLALTGARRKCSAGIWHQPQYAGCFGC